MQRHHGWRWLLVGSGIVAVGLSSLACSAPPTTFSVHGKLGAAADSVHKNGSCDFNGTVYHNGDDVVLWGADNTLLAFSHLSVGKPIRPSGPGQPGVCDLTFQFDDVRPGDAAYQLTVGSSRKMIVTEDQLRATDLQVIPGRANKDEPDFTVTGAPSSSPQPKP
ncbi:MAG: hypothetical protein QOC63_4098 [Mycobacterium sp.]|nr:hypothetical protein [Mycobacterium sp.]